jgi:hypothetical protein
MNAVIKIETTELKPDEKLLPIQSLILETFAMEG